MNKIILIIFFIFFASCSDNELNKREKFSSQVRSEVARELHRKMGLIPFGFGGGGVNGVTHLSLTFQYQSPRVSVEDARKMLIEATGLFLLRVNHNENIRPYLINYPFDSKNIDILILTQNPNGNNPENGEIVLFQMNEGQLVYKTKNSSGYLETICRETYAEALEKLAHPQT
jgi:hypothetical protein